jgi:hypothetical protein
MGDVIYLDLSRPDRSSPKEVRRRSGQKFGDDITAVLVRQAWAKALRECLGDREKAMAALHDRTRHDSRFRSAFMRFAVALVADHVFGGGK